MGSLYVKSRLRYKSFAKGWSRDREPKSSVQDGTRAGKDWKRSEDQEIGCSQTLTDDDVAQLSHKLRRPPSEIRTRHTYLLQQQLRERREAAIRISDRLNKLREKQKH